MHHRLPAFAGLRPVSAPGGGRVGAGLGGGPDILQLGACAALSRSSWAWACASPAGPTRPADGGAQLPLFATSAAIVLSTVLSAGCPSPSDRPAAHRRRHLRGGLRPHDQRRECARLARHDRQGPAVLAALLQFLGGGLFIALMIGLMPQPRLERRVLDAGRPELGAWAPATSGAARARRLRRADLGLRHRLFRRGHVALRRRGARLRNSVDRRLLDARGRLRLFRQPSPRMDRHRVHAARRAAARHGGAAVRRRGRADHRVTARCGCS